MKQALGNLYYAASAFSIAGAVVVFAIYPGWGIATLALLLWAILAWRNL